MPAVFMSFSRGLSRTQVTSPPSVMPQRTVTNVLGNRVWAASISDGGTWAPPHRNERSDASFGVERGQFASTRSFRNGVAATVKAQPNASTVSSALSGSQTSCRMSGAPVWSDNRVPWTAPMLCPRGEARKIGVSGPSEKRSANPIFSAARVLSLCMTALGGPVVLDVNMMCARSAAFAGSDASRPAGAVCHVPPDSSNRKTPRPCPQAAAASRAMSPNRAAPWRSSETSARAPVSRAA